MPTPHPGLDHSHEHTVLPDVDPPGPPDTAPHPLGIDDAEAARGLAVYRAVDDLDDHSTGLEDGAP